MSSPILKITDGINNTIDLLAINTGLLLDKWTPAIPQLKGGGTYQQSVLSDSRQLVMANYENAIETFSLKIHGGDQNAIIRYSQNMLRLLENARAYWFTPFQTNPVWLVARSPKETNTRYAIIHNYTQSGLDNPYEMPFFSSCDDVAMDDIVIAIERGHWQNVEPGQGECVKIVGGKGSSASAISVSVAAGADDGQATLGASGHTATALNVAMNHIGTGMAASGDRAGLFVRFSSVTIPDNATITRAYIQFLVEITSVGGGGDRTVIVYGNDADNATAPIDVATWNAKVLTSETKFWQPVLPSTAGNTDVTADIADIVNEIRDRPGWASGNAMQFFIEEYDCANNNIWWFAAHESVAYAQAKLYIEYTIETSPSAPTCDNEVWLVDKSHTATLSHVYLWDGAVWSVNLIDDVTIDMTDDPPVAGDKIYFGIQSSLANAGPFNSIVFNVTQINNNALVTFVWEYWQGAPTSAWTQFPASTIIDKAGGFTLENYNSLTFVPQYDTANGSWVTGDLSAIVPDGAPPAITGWWIRARVTAVGASPTVPQISGGLSSLYTVTWPQVTIANDQIAGDIPAIARVSFDNSGQQDSTPTVRNRVVVALSSLRGPYGDYESYNFSAYLPLSNTQTPPVMSTPVLAGDFSFVSDVTSPTGVVVELNPGTGGDKSFYTVVNSLHYFGSYRVFLRVRQIGGGDGDFKVKVQTRNPETDDLFTETGYQPVAVQSTSTAPNWQLLDLGLLDIPRGLPAIHKDEGANTRISIHTYVESTVGDLRFMDLIFMPTDEWIVDAQDVGTGGFSSTWNRLLHIDSITIPKVDLRALTKRDTVPEFTAPIMWKAVGTQMRMPTSVSCKLWFLTARWDNTNKCWISDATTTAKVQIYTSEQYLGLRGSR